MKKQRVLKAARNRGRLTALEVADSVGMSEGRYFRIETGRTIPTPEECAKLADFFNLKLAVLFPDRGQR